MQRVRSNKFSICVVLIALMLMLSCQMLAQTQQAEGEFKNNPLLVQHSNFFTPTVYDLQNDPKSKDHFPKNATYLACSAVGDDQSQMR